MNGFSILFLVALLLSVAIQTWLASRQIRHVAAHRGEVPAAFRTKIPEEAHRKAADYTVARTRLARGETLFSALLLLFWTFGGGIEWLDGLWRGTALAAPWQGTAVVISLFLISGALELPFSIYGTFGVEQRFGFNRSTPRLFAADLAKQLFISLLIGAPFVALILWLMGNTGGLWWFYAWLAWVGFTLLMVWAYPAFIAPLFNKFSPITDDHLKQRIEALLGRTGFASKGLYVMDGSRRSAHGNAYFTGLGDNKRIVFFDTLLASLEPEEVEAVLAHELGHFRLHHVRKRMITMSLVSLAGLALLGWLAGQSWFFQGLGVDNPSMHAALLLFLLIAPVFTVYIQPVMAHFSRKHEFEADDFAAEHADAGGLVRALVKLYQDNASTLTPDRLYSAFHDSHPPAPLRVAHLSAKIR